ncbi:Periplasmic phosphate binding protein, partial [mine drainage metagenome]
MTNDSLIGPARHASRRRGPSTGVAVTLAVVLLIVGIGAGYAVGKYAGGASTAPGTSAGGCTTTISETGSSLIYPYLQILSPNYTAQNPGICVSPASTGSGTGISSAESGIVDIGGTDAYLLPSIASQYNLINVPIAISAQLIVYHLPGITTHLNLNGTILAMIYQGAITTWNNPLIEAANPGVTLPGNTIVPLHRSDGSGDTFMFSSMCFLSWAGWTHSYGTTISWPIGPGAQGNSGMVTTLTNTPYGIAYIGISYLSEVRADAQLQYAALGDQNANVQGAVSSTGAGQQNYIMPSAQNISEDANLGLQNLEPPSVAVSLILGGVPGATDLVLGHGGTNATAAYPTPYPDTNLEYTLISTHPSSPSHQKGVVNFLEWALTYGGTYAASANFLPLTAEVIGYDLL